MPLYGVPDASAEFRNHGKYAAVKPPPEDENLTGWVMGKTASALEERIYRIMVKDSRVRRIMFRRVYGAPRRSMYGAVELDFLVFGGSVMALQIDANRWHQSAAMIARDNNQDSKLLRILRFQGVDRIQRIAGKHLKDPETAQRTWEQLLHGRIYTKWS